MGITGVALVGLGAACGGLAAVAVKEAAGRSGADELRWELGRGRMGKKVGGGEVVLEPGGGGKGRKGGGEFTGLLVGEEKGGGGGGSNSAGSGGDG